MDILADILQKSGLQRRVLNQRSFSRAVTLQFPCSKSLGFHVVTQGEVFIHPAHSKSPISLRKGDIALMARGQEHHVSTEIKFHPKTVRPFGEAELVAQGSAEKAKATLVSGAYQFWNDPIHPFFHELPEWFVIRAEDIESFDSLHSTMNLLSQEVTRQEPGSERVIQSLLDILFSLIIRKIIALKSLEIETFSHALQDPQIHKALQLLHADCSKDWSLDELAREVGLSRAGFAQKFKKSLGDTPLHYLTGLRIQKAMELLVETSDNIETVAEAVGYKDAFSFSKVFKKVTGTPPKEFRSQDRESKNHAWRFSSN